MRKSPLMLLFAALAIAVTAGFGTPRLANAQTPPTKKEEKEVFPTCDGSFPKLLPDKCAYTPAPGTVGNNHGYPEQVSCDPAPTNNKCGTVIWFSSNSFTCEPAGTQKDGKCPDGRAAYTRLCLDSASVVTCYVIKYCQPTYVPRTNDDPLYTCDPPTSYINRKVIKKDGSCEGLCYGEVPVTPTTKRDTPVEKPAPE